MMKRLEQVAGLGSTAESCGVGEGSRHTSNRTLWVESGLYREYSIHYSFAGVTRLVQVQARV